MRAVILADAAFAARERAMLSRLEVGLADEGVRIVHAIPERSARWLRSEVFAQAVTYLDEGLPLSLGWRIQQLVSTLEELAGPGPRPPRAADIIHAFGQPSWGFAAELAAQTGAALALEVWAADLVRPAVRLRYGPDHAMPTCLAPGRAIESMLREEDVAAPVRLTPWGVHTPPAARQILPEGRALSALVIGSGRDTQGMLAALEGLALVAADHRDLMIFADADAVTRANLWPSVKRLGLVDRFTMIPDVEARREPGLRADLLISPEARGEYRSLTLDAMASGMLVIAAADPAVSFLLDDQTARLVSAQTPERWHEALSWALGNPAGARQLAAAAREYIREHTRASAHVAAVMDVYEWLTTGEAIPFA
jgi:glycosyltransferase involved in cell wall biosynthesis